MVRMVLGAVQPDRKTRAKIRSRLKAQAGIAALHAAAARVNRAARTAIYIVRKQAYANG